LARSRVYGADVPVGAVASTHAVFDAGGRVAACAFFEAEGQEEKESRQEGAAQGKEKEGRQEKEVRQEETPPLDHFHSDIAGASRRGAPARHVQEDNTVPRASYLVLVALAACSAPKVQIGDPQQEIGAMLQRSAADWNRGDLDGFMSDYAKDSLTSYRSGAHMQYGWQALYDRYLQSYFSRGKSHDSLSFDEVRVRALTTDLAYATARFTLSHGDSVVSSGPFTLVLQRQGDRWKILHDHTSADPR
jgi:ketosteroid isomerase-like protein